LNNANHPIYQLINYKFIEMIQFESLKKLVITFNLMKKFIEIFFPPLHDLIPTYLHESKVYLVSDGYQPRVIKALKTINGELYSATKGQPGTG
jgi:hypothetical protein